MGGARPARHTGSEKHGTRVAFARARTPAAIAVALAALAMLTALAGACGNGGGAGGAESAAEEWVRGWQQASGGRRDDIAAGQLRTLLTEELRQQTQGQGARIFNELMMLPFPPDEGFEIVSAETQDGTATVVVQLNYSEGAAAQAAANGVITFDDVEEARGVVAADPSRTLHLVEVEGEWLIESISE